jgi:hypothetical protein
VAGQSTGNATPGVATLAEFVPGSATDQALPADGFYARWRRAPTRLVMGEGEDEFLGPGWYPPEDWPPPIRWTSERAVAYLTQEEWPSNLVVTMCRPQHEARAASGRVLVDGRLAGTFELAAPALEPFSFPVDPVGEPKEIEVVIQVDNVLEPSAAASDDRRTLGVAVHSLSLE